MTLTADFTYEMVPDALFLGTYRFTNTSPAGYDPLQTKWIVSAAGLSASERLEKGTLYGPGVNDYTHVFPGEGYFEVSLHINGGGQIGRCYKTIKVGNPPEPEPTPEPTPEPAPEPQPEPEPEDITHGEALELLIRSIVKDELSKIDFSDETVRTAVRAALKDLIGAL
jgi:hypothetical protein